VSSYKDEKPLGVIPPGFDPYVAPYFTFDLLVTYKGLKDTTITAGIKNLWDKDPPFSAHNVDDVGGTGWDARVGDPRGRSFYIAAAYKFK
jgi:iron complex outermembrane receptor protein